MSNKGKEVGDGILASNHMKKNYAAWQPPSTEFYKINIDTSFVEAINATSVGWLSETTPEKFSFPLGIILGLAIALTKRKLERHSSACIFVSLFTNPLFYKPIVILWLLFLEKTVSTGHPLLT